MSSVILSQLGKLSFSTESFTGPGGSPRAHQDTGTATHVTHTDEAT